jgi:sporadic carbohydrate cluster protein (TIGR04323 family)
MNVVGYITSDGMGQGFVPHQIQNLMIRRFLESKGLRYLLSWTEHKGKAPFVLRSLLREIFYDGICFYSIEQLGGLPDAGRMLTEARARGLWVGFAREALVLDGVDEVMALLWFKRNLEGSRPDLGALWGS